MKYNIKRMYTESVNTSFFQNFIENDNIGLIVNLHTNFIQKDNEKDSILKVIYSVTANNIPIYLNCVVVCILEMGDNNQQKIDSNKFLDNPIIIKFLDNTINHLSFFVGGDLPKIANIKGDSKKND